jgi:hypothetical protein
MMGEMRRAMLVWVLFPVAALACRCVSTTTLCGEVSNTDLVFTGTVEAIAPAFLDSWDASQRAALDLLNRESARAGAELTPEAFARLREAYLRIFPDLPSDHKKRLTEAATPEALSEVFYWILDHGKRVRLRVKTVYRGEFDADDGDGDVTTAEVWTSFGDCGVNFQVGETYLVYADDDEESGILATGICTRTRRLTDAGEDLAYLAYYADKESPATRLDGFVTSDASFMRTFDPDRYTGRIQAPVAAVVELRAGGRSRYTEPDAFGHFVFDGVTGGEVSLTAYAPGFPAERRRIAGPVAGRVEDRCCAMQVLVAPAAAR